MTEEDIEKIHAVTEELTRYIYYQFEHSSDQFINASYICKIANIEFGDWYKLKETKELFQALKKIEYKENPTKYLNMDEVKVIEIRKGYYNSSSEEYWIHPDAVITMASWISPKFSLQICRMVNKLIHVNSSPKE